jgi:hypothetical protein
MNSLQNPEDYSQVVNRLSKLQPDSLRLWGKMTAQQVICHLSDSFLAALGAKQVSLATGIFQRTIMKWGALYVPMPWPKGVPTRPEVEQGRGGTPPEEFEQDRAKLLDVMQRFRTSNETLQDSVHPIFGRLTYGQWMRWGYLHTDHHLRQFGR